MATIALVLLNSPFTQNYSQNKLGYNNKMSFFSYVSDSYGVRQLLIKQFMALTNNLLTLFSLQSVYPSAYLQPNFPNSYWEPEWPGD